MEWHRSALFFPSRPIRLASCPSPRILKIALAIFPGEFSGTRVRHFVCYNVFRPTSSRGYHGFARENRLDYGSPKGLSPLMAKFVTGGNLEWWTKISATIIA
jgi:hypothetical protein